MTQPTTDPAGAPQDGKPATTPAPPWGTDDQFDPHKAWNLIQNLRGDLEKKNHRIAELAPYEQKARELEDAQKSELQRATEALAAAQAEASAARLDAMRLAVAAAKGVPQALAGRLQGGTAQELEADADALMAAFPQQAATPPTTVHTPVEALRPGSLPHPPPPSLAERIADAEKAGDHQLARRLKNQQLITSR